MALPDGDRTPNAKLEAIALSVQDFVESITNRQLEARTYYDDQQWSILDGNGRAWIYVPQYPVSYVSSVAIDADRAWGTDTEIGLDDVFWYPMSGKVMSEGGYFTKGHRNVKINYTAGYAPIVGGTHNAMVSTYPLPYDLRQMMIEMSVESIKEGITAVHTVVGQEESKFIQMLSRNSFWSKVISKYTNFAVGLGDRDE